jgi:HEAT repeat protein
LVPRSSAAIQANDPTGSGTGVHRVPRTEARRIDRKEGDVKTPHYSQSVLHTLIALHREEDLSILQRRLETEWIADLNLRNSLRTIAAKGVASYLSDQAAEIMLHGLASSSSGVRMACADRLDSLEATRNRQESWNSRHLQKLTKESALDELLVMPSSGNMEIRVKAIRGIATFGAIEYLPTLIRLLADPDAKNCRGSTRCHRHPQPVRALSP